MSPAYRNRGAAMGAARPGQPLMLDPPAKGQRPNLSGDVADAKYLLGKVVKDDPGIVRRVVLAKWMTSKTNPWFSQAYANRLWAYFMGHGIVHPVDDFNSANKPSNPELLKYLANGSRFDFRGLIWKPTMSPIKQQQQGKVHPVRPALGHDE